MFRNEDKNLPDARDFNTIETLKDNYITNWDEIPKEIQNFIMNCNRYWIKIQEVLLYHDNHCVASLGIDRWNRDIRITSGGAGELFQWNLRDGFTENNFKAD